MTRKSKPAPEQQAAQQEGTEEPQTNADTGTPDHTNPESPPIVEGNPSDGTDEADKPLDVDQDLPKADTPSNPPPEPGEQGQPLEAPDRPEPEAVASSSSEDIPPVTFTNEQPASAVIVGDPEDGKYPDKPKLPFEVGADTQEISNKLHPEVGPSDQKTTIILPPTQPVRDNGSQEPTVLLSQSEVEEKSAEFQAGYAAALAAANPQVG